MQKIRLEIDALRVESFDTDVAANVRGTVHGRHHTFEPGCGEPPPDDSINICPIPTAPATCGYTCGNTCSCGCTQTYHAWTCDPYASACTEPDPGTYDINVCR